MADDEAVSLAGRVLSRGNPFQEGSTSRTAIANMFPPEHRDFLMTRLVAFLSPFVEASLSLAGHILGEEAAADMAAQAFAAPIEEPSIASRIIGTGALATPPLEPAAHVIALLKGMHPAGTTWGHLAIAAGLDTTLMQEARAELRTLSLVREEDEPDGIKVYASLDVMANAAIPALPWPTMRA